MTAAAAVVTFGTSAVAVILSGLPVSYTHLDVYKRQALNLGPLKYKTLN